MYVWTVIVSGIRLQFSMPMVLSTRGQGGERFDQTMGFPGVYFSANITPSGIGGWTDGEIYRAITTGVRKNGKPIFPVMPYHSYGLADPEDVKCSNSLSTVA